MPHWAKCAGRIASDQPPANLCHPSRDEAGLGQADGLEQSAVSAARNSGLELIKDGAKSVLTRAGRKLQGAEQDATAARILDEIIRRQPGWYTSTHASGKTYDGKGSRYRSQQSGKRVERGTGDEHIAADCKPSNDNRDAFKDESKRLDSHGGVASPGNYNRLESPGRKYRTEDGDWK